MNRASIPFVVSSLIDGRPVRWGRSVFHYDGCDRTLQVFNADVQDQLELRKRIDTRREELQEAAGGPLVIIFHSVKQSAERYGDFIASFPKVVDVPVRSLEGCTDVKDPIGPHRQWAPC
jgi:hypothetical protein